MEIDQRVTPNVGMATEIGQLSPVADQFITLGADLNCPSNAFTTVVSTLSVLNDLSPRGTWVLETHGQVLVLVGALAPTTIEVKIGDAVFSIAAEAQDFLAAQLLTFPIYNKRLVSDGLVTPAQLLQVRPAGQAVTAKALTGQGNNATRIYQTLRPL